MASEITESHGGAAINFWRSNQTGGSFEIDMFRFGCQFQLQCSELRDVLFWNKIAARAYVIHGLLSSSSLHLSAYLTQKSFVCEIAALPGIFRAHCFIQRCSFKLDCVDFHSNIM